MNGIKLSKIEIKMVEPKQETLEEAAENYSRKMWGVYYYDAHPDIVITKMQGEISVEDFIEGAKWQQERMYSEEDMAESFMACWKANMPEGFECKLSFNEWFEQFKKK